MRIELQVGEHKLLGCPVRVFLGFTSQWYSATRDADRLRNQIQVSVDTLYKAEREVPRAFSHFQKWVISCRIDLYNVEYNEFQFNIARQFLTTAFLSNETVRVIHYAK